jgi:hypothetical protein
MVAGDHGEDAASQNTEFAVVSCHDDHQEQTTSCILHRHTLIEKAKEKRLRYVLRNAKHPSKRLPILC